MITKDEIEAKAKEFEIHTSNVQRDYVFGWLLWGIFTQSSLKEIMFLKGGNALRKCYFENTRYSSDLDFGIPHDIEQSLLQEEIEKVCKTIEEHAGVIFAEEDTQVEEKFTASDVPLPDLKVYEVRVYFKDFYGNADHIKLRISMDVTRFDKVILPIQTRNLIHPYSDAEMISCEIHCMKLEEIIATKMKCLMQRQHAPDLFDYAYSIKLLGGELNKQEVIETLIQKTIFGNNPAVLKNILLKTAFDFFKTQWAKSVVCAKQTAFDVEEAITTFLSDLEVLFSPYPDTGVQYEYFGADLRIPIMQAARAQTLLKIVYKGEERIVEPYSLKYQQRRDGVEREYFFAYKVSGGGQSGPGIKMLVAENMDSIENTDEKFVPRYQIELSKAGEMPEDRYLFDPNKPERAPRARVARNRTRRSAGSSGIRYIFKCSVCGKRSQRNSYDTTQRPHKGKNGYPCYGYPLYVDTKYGF